MRKYLHAVVAVAALCGSMAAYAVPVSYSLAYEATEGSSGVGSFDFDSDIGAITNFAWNFGGQIGGLSDSHFGPWDVFGDTRGRFVFEMLSQTDVHSGAICMPPNGCGTGDGIDVGSGPLGANYLTLNTYGGATTYQFTGGQASFVGNLRLVRKVPEPATLGLLGAALLGVALMRRRSSAAV